MFKRCVRLCSPVGRVFPLPPRGAFVRNTHSTERGHASQVHLSKLINVPLGWFHTHTYFVLSYSFISSYSAVVPHPPQNHVFQLFCRGVFQPRSVHSAAGLPSTAGLGFFRETCDNFCCHQPFLIRARAGISDSSQPGGDLAAHFKNNQTLSFGVPGAAVPTALRRGTAYLGDPFQLAMTS